MILTINQRAWECIWKVMVQHIPGGMRQLYTSPMTITNYSTVTIRRDQPVDNPDCCFNQRENLPWTNPTSTDNPLSLTVDMRDRNIALSTKPCPKKTLDCTPWYIDIETLLCKANSICKRYQVSFEEVNPDFPFWAFTIYDTCTKTEDDPVVAAVIDPNALLAILERLCIDDLTTGEPIPL